MMAEDAPYKNALTEQFKPFDDSIVSSGKVPLETNAVTGKTAGNAPSGFVAALLPLLAEDNASQTVTALQQQIMMDTRFTTSRYYDSVLYLFGNSALNKRFVLIKQGFNN